MIDFKKDKMLPILGLVGLGLFAQKSDINIASNTTILLLIFFILMEDERINELEEIARHEYCHLPGPHPYAPARGCCDGCYR